MMMRYAAYPLFLKKQTYLIQFYKNKNTPLVSINSLFNKRNIAFTFRFQYNSVLFHIQALFSEFFSFISQL